MFDLSVEPHPLDLVGNKRQHPAQGSGQSVMSPCSRSWTRM